MGHRQPARVLIRDASSCAGSNPRRPDAVGRCIKTPGRGRLAAASPPRDLGSSCSGALRRGLFLLAGKRPPAISVWCNREASRKGREGQKATPGKGAAMGFKIKYKQQMRDRDVVASGGVGGDGGGSSEATQPKSPPREPSPLPRRSPPPPREPAPSPRRSPTPPDAEVS